MSDLINKFFNPLYLQRTDIANKLGPDAVIRDAARKTAGYGSVFLLLSLLSGNDAAKKDRLDRKHRKALETSLGTDFVEIPSKGEPIQTQIERNKRVDKIIADLEENKELYKDEDLEMLKESTFNPNTPFYQIPVVLTAIAIGAAGGAKLGSSISADKRDKDLDKDIRDINDEIGTIIQDELARTRGLGKEAEFDLWEWAKTVPIKVLGASAVIAGLAGMYLGYDKGKKSNENYLINKQLTRALFSQGNIHKPGKIVLPKELVEGEQPPEVKKERMTSAVSPITELSI